MRFITSLHGIVAIRATNDDVGPAAGFLPSDVINFVGDAYNFEGRPQIPEGLPQNALSVLQFQFGQMLTDAGARIPIHQINIFNDGDAVIAQDTDLADLAMTDYLKKMDEGLGFRYLQMNPARRYISNVVVEFDPGFVERSGTIAAIERALALSMEHTEPKYRLKRLAFGADAASATVIAGSVISILRQDFLIERRGNEPMESNRFFCVAPLSTKQHLAALEAIEKAAMA